ncbi:MAG: EF-hand domain-containing protein [Candidatus Sphingomonas phytovorans]|nr:EF-hand domain-containing protein [Sphingomonas sp.]WEK02500.1 MAG: EF-hand domain-containing protein [Sphingomonas sp.]
MWRYIAGGASALLLVTAGVMLSTGRARPPSPLATQPVVAVAQEEPLPAGVPEASERTREQKRFDRYDKDRNAQVTREEYLVQRRKAFAKLDTNQDGQLSFDEWAVKTTTKFALADKDKSGAMNAAEFATTAPKRTVKRRPNCPPAQAPREDEEA